MRRAKSAMPGFIKPQLATLKMKAPSGVDWIHEIKYDGYRIQLHIDGDIRKAFTRNGHNWVSKLSNIVGAFAIPCQAIVDGEVVVIHEGRTNFSELQAELAGRRQDRLVSTPSTFCGSTVKIYGEHLSSPAKELFDTHGIEAPALYSEHLIGNGQEMFEHAARLNFEGIVSKRVEAPYRSDRNDGWLKIKAVQREKFPVVGFVKDPTGIAALYLGKKEGKDLVYMGKVGTGWNRTTSAQNPQGARYRRQSPSQAHQAHQEAQGQVGRAEVLCRG